MATQCPRRILTEITKLQSLATDYTPSSVQFLLDETPVDKPGSNKIVGRILPNSEIYNQAAFQIEMIFPTEYPFKPPDVHFITPIYHPNVDDGKISIDMLYTGGSYSPRTSLIDIVKAVVHLIDKPDLNNALKPEIAAEYSQNRATFDQKALELVTKHGLPRP
ncbi:unnamed protein product [Rotaria sordida]|uniref:UBC core domain-containing protein n=1 Tax=Rotaria sordida TaxID=392033 RepID=A0A816DPT5_9BILA|nr:unnamed protein product [Rotaria sordida]CAF1639365.1 unnamed protein product [Rotaria sordida]